MSPMYVHNQFSISKHLSILMNNSTKIIRFIENLCLNFITMKYELTRNAPLIVYLYFLLFALLCEFVINLRHILQKVKVVKHMQ